MIELLFPSQQSGFLSRVLSGEGEYKSCFEFLDCIFMYIARVFLFFIHVQSQKTLGINSTWKILFRCPESI